MRHEWYGSTGMNFTLPFIINCKDGPCNVPKLREFLPPLDKILDCFKYCAH